MKEIHCPNMSEMESIIKSEEEEGGDCPSMDSPSQNEVFQCDGDEEETKEEEEKASVDEGAPPSTEVHSRKQDQRLARRQARHSNRERYITAVVDVLVSQATLFFFSPPSFRGTRAIYIASLSCLLETRLFN